MTHTPLRSVLRASIFLLILSLPLSVEAIAPGAPSRIKITDVKAGQIQLEWTAPADKNISYYRVYYSRASILGSGGKYDDFEITPTNSTSFTLTGYPEGSKLYIGVLAVNESGEESPFFTEEAIINLTKPGSTSSVSSAAASASAASSSSVGTAEPQKLLSAKVLSSTGILLTFSLPVSLAQDEAKKAFEIDDGSGALLALRQLVIKDNTIIIKTAPQLKEHPYTLDVSTVVKGKSPMGVIVDLDMSTASVNFMGDANGAEPFKPSLIPTSSSSKQSSSSAESSEDSSSAPVSSSSSSSVQGTTLSEVANLRLQAQRGANGLYTVIATWTHTNNPATVSGFQLQQTRDRGASYAAMQFAAATVQSVRFSSVPAGDFGLLVKVRGTDGTVTKGIIQSVALPMDKPTGPLTDSGPSILALLVAAGGTGGALLMRKKKLA